MSDLPTIEQVREAMVFLNRMPTSFVQMTEIIVKILTAYEQGKLAEPMSVEEIVKILGKYHAEFLNFGVAINIAKALANKVAKPQECLSDKEIADVIHRVQEGNINKDYLGLVKALSGKIPKQECLSECPNCKGTGRIKHKHSPHPKLIGMVMLECSDCGGSGKIRRKVGREELMELTYDVENIFNVYQNDRGHRAEAMRTEVDRVKEKIKKLADRLLERMG